MSNYQFYIIMAGILSIIGNTEEKEGWKIIFYVMAIISGIAATASRFL